KVAMDNAKAGFDSFLADEIRYTSLVDEQKRLEAREDWDGVGDMQVQIDANYYYQYIQARQRFVSLLDATPLLVVEVDDVPLYEAFADPSLFPLATSGMSPAASDQRYVDLVNTYLDGGIAKTNEQIVIFSTMTDLPSLSQLAS